MFCDITKITVQAWKWWNWCVSAHKAKFLEFWWPDWWNWWKWWDFIIKVNPHLNSLIDLHLKKSFKAEDWSNWKWKNKNWKDWNNFFLEVPIWTIIKNLDDWNIIDLCHEDSQFIIAKWGRWWYWNAHFKSSTRQFPDFAENWEPTKEINIEVELKLIADVWIIWIPSSWKSTLIWKITNLKPKIWDYQFTTIIPNIWVAKIYDNSLVFADIPWLIEWASEWRWLWTEFLRHISRNSVLIHLLDWNSIDIFKDFETVQKEIKKYSKKQFLQNNEQNLFSKKQIIVINKVDILDNDSIELIKKDFIEKCMRKKSIHNFKNLKEIKDSILSISAITWEWIILFLSKAWNLVLEIKKSNTIQEKVSNVKSERILYQPHLNEWRRYFELEILSQTRSWKKTFLIKWKRIEQIAKMTNFSQEWWLNRLYDIIKKLWIKNSIIAMWWQDNDLIKFWDCENLLKFKENI